MPSSFRERTLFAIVERSRFLEQGMLRDFKIEHLNDKLYCCERTRREMHLWDHLKI